MKSSVVMGITGNRALVHSIEAITAELGVILEKHTPRTVITGMALGFDQLVAEECIKRSIPFIAAVPFNTQACMWSKPVQERYLGLLELASEVVVVSEGNYEPWKMFKRNEWIVNNSDLVCAYLQTGDGGTVHTVNLAKKANKVVEYILPKAI